VKGEKGTRGGVGNKTKRKCLDYKRGGFNAPGVISETKKYSQGRGGRATSRASGPRHKKEGRGWRCGGYEGRQLIQ